MNIEELAVRKHREWKGKIEVVPRAEVKNAEQLSVAYTPGVAGACMAIKNDPAQSYELTRRRNLVAVVTDGSAVLGLGNIGAEASMPVMEGKCVLFKEFADVDAFPICLGTQDTEEIIETVYNISKSFGGINLEDIAAPRCFEIEKRLRKMCDIPVFHDDQHGTAIVAAAALLNALKPVGKKIENVKIVINGAGSAGSAIARHLLSLGAKDIIMCARDGILHKGMHNLNEDKKELCELTNLTGKSGTLADAMKNADVFMGVSAPNTVTAEMVRSMNDGAIVFPMANPVPEIMPEEAYKAGAALVGTGRSDFPNQINNVLAFPGIFRGALDIGASDITKEMEIAATHAIADLVSEDELSRDYILPRAFDKRVGMAVAKAVAAAGEPVRRRKDG